MTTFNVKPTAQLVLGAAQFGMTYGINNTTGKPSLDAIGQILLKAAENNIKEIDTAQGYGDSEETLQKVLNHKTDQYIIHSKFKLDGKIHVSQINDSLKKTINTLKIKKIGYFFFHDFNQFDQMKNQKIDSDFISQKSLGLGASVYNIEEFDKAINTPWIKAIQLPINLFDISEKKIKLIEQAVQLDKKIYCRSVFLQGLFFKPVETLPSVLQPLKPKLVELQAISKKHNVPVADLALAFVKSIFGIHGVLIGVETVSQLEKNISSFKTDVSTEILNQIGQLRVKEHTHLLHPLSWVNS